MFVNMFSVGAFDFALTAGGWADASGAKQSKTGGGQNKDEDQDQKQRGLNH